MRPPMKPLKPLDEALAELLGHATPLTGVDTVTTFDAEAARLTASRRCKAAADNSSMDGYAVRCADVAAAGALRPYTAHCSGRGRASQPGTAASSPAPQRLQVRCHPDAGRSRRRRWPRAHQRRAAAGQGSRAGEDITRGAVVCPPHAPHARRAGPGCQITHQRGGAPPARGAGTGDELVMPGDVPPEQMRPGAIYNSNRFARHAAAPGLRGHRLRHRARPARSHHRGPRGKAPTT